MQVYPFYWRSIDYKAYLPLFMGVATLFASCSIEDRLPPGVHIVKPGEKPTDPKDIDPNKLPGEKPEGPGAQPGDSDNPLGPPLGPEFPDEAPDVPDWPSGPVTPPEVTILSVSPTFGPMAGGGEVRIRGTYFTDKTRIFFGSEEADCRYETQSGGREMVCDLPAAKLAGSVSIKLIQPKTFQTPVEAKVLKDAFTYYRPASVGEIRPSKIPISDGRNNASFIQIIGEGFTPETGVTVAGMEAIEVRYIDEQHLRVLPAPFDPKMTPTYGEISLVNPTVTVPITLTTRYGSTLVPSGLEYYAPVQLRMVKNAQGRSVGGESVTIEGDGFDKTSKVYFGRSLATVTSMSNDGRSLTVTTPKNRPGYTDITVTNRVDSEIKQDAYYYTSSSATPLDIANVVPSVGLKSGGGEVVISGSGLGAGAQVEFEAGGEHLPATVVDTGEGWVKVAVPQWLHPTPGVVRANLTVRMPAAGGKQQSFTKSAAYFYTDPISITSALPAVTPARGGEQITLKGSGLAQITGLKLDGLPIPFTVLDEQTVQFVAPKHRPGKGILQVEVHDEKIARFKDIIDFTEDFRLTSVTPTVASISGGSFVEIIGEGFTDQTTVTFDGLAPTAIKERTSHRIVVTAPPHAAGDVNIVVTDNSQTPSKSVTYKDLFYYMNPTHQGGAIFGGPIEGALNVAVLSSKGGPIPKALITLSTNATTPYYAVSNEKGLATLSGPDILGEQTLSVSAYGYTSISVQRVNASNITVVLDLKRGFTADSQGIAISLDDLPPEQPMPGEEVPPPLTPETPLPLPVIHGNLIGLDKLGIPQSYQFLRGYVFTTQAEVYSPNRFPLNQAELQKSGPYRIQTREGDLAVVAVGGLYDTRDGSFRPLAMGIKRNITMAKGEVKRVDITLDIPTNVTMRTKLDGFPSLLSGRSKNVRAWIHLGYEGYFNLQMTDFEVESGNIVEISNQPNIARDLPGASYYLEGGVYSGSRWSVPRTTSILRDVTDQSHLIEFPGLYGIPTLLETQQDLDRGIRPSDTLHFTLDPPQKIPDLILINLDDSEGNTIWTMTLPGDARSFKLPPLPKKQIEGVTERNGKSLETYPPGAYNLFLFAIDRRNGNYNHMTLSKLLSLRSMDGVALQKYSVTILPN